MSEQEKIELSVKLQAGLESATLKMLKRKAQLGEPVVISDNDGLPVIISAQKALDIFSAK